MMDGVQLFPFSEYWWFYALFTVFIVGLPATDLGLFHRDRPFPHVEVRTGGDSDFIGVKMLWLNDRFQGKFPIGISLGIIRRPGRRTGRIDSVAAARQCTDHFKRDAHRCGMTNRVHHDHCFKGRVSL
jgi:hypothetical protein